MDINTFIQKNTLTSEQVEDDRHSVSSEEGDPSVDQGRQLEEQIAQEYDPSRPGIEECSPLPAASSRKRGRIAEDIILESDEEEREDTPASSAQPLEETKPPQTKRAKRQTNQLRMTLAAIICSLPLIRIDSYAMAYNKYKTSPLKMNRTLRALIFQVLTYWGTLSHSTNGSQSLQQSISADRASSLCTTLCPSGLKKALTIWFANFTTTPAENTKTPVTETAASSLSATMLPSPRSQRICTSSTTADGRTRPVGVPGSAAYTPPRDLFAEAARTDHYLPQTSSLLRSMSWQDTANRYSLRSRANSGDLCIKLEMYHWSTVAGIPSQDWWKHAEMRGFVMADYDTRVERAAVELFKAMKAHLEAQDDHEAKFVQKRY